MKLQKRISIWAGIISFASLALSIGFNLYGYSYISNVFVGLFSSGILMCVTSLLTYFSERNKTILSLYRGCYRFFNQLNSNLTPDGKASIDNVKENLSKMIDSYQTDIYYYICELSGIRKHSKLNKVIMSIWEAAQNIYLLVVDDNEQIMKFYLGDISKKDILDYKFKYVGSESINYTKDLQKSLDDLRYHMNYYNCKKGNGEDKHHAD